MESGRFLTLSVAKHCLTPLCDDLVDLIAQSERAIEIKASSQSWPSWDLTPRQLCDLELLLNGGFSPLRGFMTQADYESVCHGMKLTNGALWPMPVTLDVTAEFARSLNPGSSKIALRDPEGLMLAMLHVEDVWRPDRGAEAAAVFRTTSPIHPGVDHLLNTVNPWYVGGRVEGIHLPMHHDFESLRLTPVQLRAEFVRLGWRQVVGFQTCNPMHRAHQELTARAAQLVEANLLLHPSVGIIRPEDGNYFTRVRCYELLLARYLATNVRLALVPLATRMAGPREAVWHGLIRKNYGVTHFLVSRDHASPEIGADGARFYESSEAQELFKKHEDEIGVTMVPLNSMVYLESQRRYVPEEEAPKGSRVFDFSSVEINRLLREDGEIPGWATYPEVLHELRRSHPPRHKQGLTIFFTGLSGSGKSTIANVLLAKLMELGDRLATLLDGDLVRKHLSSELGFSKEHRNLNIRRIGYVASEITRHGGVAVCAPIAPYDSVRKQVRQMIEPHGGFVLVYVATCVEVCEQRDCKGLYAKARAGVIKEFTGISDPYEVPTDADLVIDTGELSSEEAVRKILFYLKHQGFIGKKADPTPKTRRQRMLVDRKRAPGLQPWS